MPCGCVRYTRQTSLPDINEQHTDSDNDGVSATSGGIICWGLMLPDGSMIIRESIEVSELSLLTLLIIYEYSKLS